jgi:hypothetical protein
LLVGLMQRDRYLSVYCFVDHFFSSINDFWLLLLASSNLYSSVSLHKPGNDMVSMDHTKSQQMAVHFPLII